VVQIHLLTATTSIELMERANAVLAELQTQFCTIEDVKFIRTGVSTEAGGHPESEITMLIIYDTPVEQALRTDT
jgi:hypothetical protein